MNRRWRQKEGEEEEEERNPWKEQKEEGASSPSIPWRIYIFTENGAVHDDCVPHRSRDKLRYPRALNYARETINRDTGETVDVNKASCRVESVSQRRLTRRLSGDLR